MNHKNILIVDDHEINNVILARFLRSEGYFVVSEDNPLNVISQLNICKFNLIILDIQMDGISGKDLAKQILSINKDIPLVSCSAYSMLEFCSSEKEFYSIFKAHIEKPVDMKYVKYVVETYIS